MVHIIGIPNCNKIRDTKKWLDTNGIDYELINVKKEPLTRDELKDLEFKVGLDVLVNSKGTTYRNLKIKDLDLSEEQLFDVLLENQSMIKRPVIAYENSVLVGYDEEAFEVFFKENNLISAE
ncbi:MAG: arsenate reductase family protein [Balneolaceae bacterium]